MPNYSGATLEVVIAIDTDKWEELERQGYSEADIKEMIEKSIAIKADNSPILDIDEVSLLKFY